MDLLFLLKAIVIAIVEGVTEFLPVSSTGHMIIAGHLMDFPEGDFSNFYEVFIQAGAILAIIVLYRKKIGEILLSFFRWEKRGRHFAAVVIIGSLPAVAAGVLLEDFIDEHLFTTWIVLAGLFAGALLLIITEKYFKDKARIGNVEEIGIGQAIKIGLFQCLSMWPGMSRSSSTIIGGWVTGLSTSAAAEFSFFLAIPLMIGAAGFKTLKFWMRGGFDAVGTTEAVSLSAGFVVAFIVALVCVKGFVAFISKRPMKYFGYYRIALSAVMAVLLLTKVI
ncbi:MAG: undecaprenyl-diphosphate phosphatase [Saccharofermentanales bacterium]